MFIPKVFIVILNWNNYADTAECLLSLNNLENPNFQVVLVDNASTDGSVQKLQKEFPNVHIIINPENFGFASGCNVGIKFALENGADCVLLLNNDAAMEKQSLDSSIKMLFSSKNVGIVGGKIKNYYDRSYIETTGSKRIIWPIIATRAVGGGELDIGQYDKVDKRLVVSGALMLIKRKVFENVGLLPEEYFFGCEDVDFCINVHRNGFKILYSPNFVAYHKGGRSSGKNPKYIYNYFLHRILLINRNIIFPIIGIAFLYLYARFFWLKRFTKKEKLPLANVKQLRKAIQLSFKNGLSLHCVKMQHIQEWKMSRKGLAIVRIGDQALYRLKDHKDQYFAEGYYQLREIADMFGDRLASFTAFGRIMQIEDYINHLYLIPIDSVPRFAEAGPRVERKGFLAYMRVLPKLVWKVRRTTVIHDVSWFILPSLAGVIGSLVASKRTLRVVQLVGEWSMPLRLRYPRLAPLIVPLAEWFIRLALHRADFAVFVSNYLKEKYGQKLQCQVMVANESRLRLGMIHKVNRQEIHNPLRILYVGRLVPEKGVQLLLEAVAFVSKEMSCELWIAGSGPFEEELRTKANELEIAELMHWKGWVPWGEKLFELMRETDVLVMPTLPLIEGVGMVHFEAMSQSLPVIASRVDGIPEIVKDGVSGVLVEPGNPFAIAQAIRQIATDTKLRKKLVTEGLRVAKDNTVEIQTGRVIETICQLVYKKKKRKEKGIL